MENSTFAIESFLAKICKIIFCIQILLVPRTSFSTETDQADDIYDYDFSQLAKIKIISATKTIQSIFDVPSTVYIISSSEIKEKGYLTLDEVLSGLPGFQFRNILSFNSYSFLRGVPNQNNLILVLIDGVQINELNSGGFYGGGQYNLSNVDRIEVVYGPLSVAYGTNAVSGIINIITKDAAQNQFEMNALIGGFNTIGADFTISATNNKNYGLRFSGMFKRTTKADLKGLAGDNNWTDLLDNFENDYSFDFKIKAGNFTFGSNYQQKQSSCATFVKSIGTIYKDYGTLWNINFFNNYIKYENQFSRNFYFKSLLYNRNATVLDNTVLYVVDTAQIGYYRPNNLLGFENIVTFLPFDILSLTASLTLEYERLAEKYSITQSASPKEKPPTPEAPPMKNNFLASVFLETLFNPIENLAILGGLRFDNSSVYHQVLTPQFGASYNFYNQIIRVWYSEAFRAPKPWDYYDGLGNNDLQPEKLKSLEIGLN